MDFGLSIVGFLILLFVIYRLYEYLHPSLNVDSKGKYVLISGCDSGFGKQLAIQLDQQGFHVLATVLIPTNIELLKGIFSSRSDVFLVDITNDDHISEMYEIISRKTRTLHALVNNAGIDGGSFIDMTSMEVMHRVMNVNFYGHVSMTKRFLPLLISKQGSRVVNICSVAGYISSPGLSSYCASKYAFEAFSDCLRREMYPWGLKVSIIEPSYMKTPMLERTPMTFEDYWKTLDEQIQQRWGKDFLFHRLEKSKNNFFFRYAENPRKVIDALEHSVMNTKPRIRYRPGWQSSFVFFPISMLPSFLADYFYYILINTKQRPQSVEQQDG